MLLCWLLAPRGFHAAVAHVVSHEGFIRVVVLLERLPEDVDACLDVLLRVHHVRNAEFLVEPAVVADVNLHEAEVSGVADRVRLVAALPLDDGEGDFKRDALPFRLLPDVPLQLVAHRYVV